MNKTFTAFLGSQALASGNLSEVAVALHGSMNGKQDAMPLVFDDDTGNQVELDLRGGAAEVAARYINELPAVATELHKDKPAASGRGRPRLGVVAREVTLLPEHWDWLASQPGGASVALRKLVHEARQASTAHDRHRHACERAYKVMVALAGNLPGFEEASRALFAQEPGRLAEQVKFWPADIRDYVLRLANPEPVQVTGKSS